MRVFEKIEETRQNCEELRRDGAQVGLVPTMGAFHEGHLSLIRACRSQCDFALVSIFVNPAQFGPGEDYEAYPRNLAADLRACATEGVDAVFAPAVAEMYPAAPTVSVDAVELSSLLEGSHRPGHFAGVALVVAKLFGAAGECRAFFGEKDWQQLAVVRAMVAELAMPIEVIGCPVVRDADGLALSSRNVYLSASERAAAPVLNRCLRRGREMVLSGERSLAALEAAMVEVLASEPRVVPDYAVAVNAVTLLPVDPLQGELRLLVAAKLGETRLIDNLGVAVETDAL